MKSLRVLGKHHDIVPTSFFCRNVRRDGAFPVSGGGFAVSAVYCIQIPADK